MVNCCVAATTLAPTCDVTVSYLLKYKFCTLFALKCKGSHIFVNGKGYVKSQSEYDSCDVSRSLLCT
jgi:hypothetical protein